MVNILKKKKRKWDGLEIVATIVLTIIIIIIVVPFWNAIVLSFETEAAYTRQPFSWLPGEVTLANYQQLFLDGNKLILAYKSTILITIIGTVLAMAVTTTAAYGFSRRFPGKKIFMVMMLASMFFSGGLIPAYLNLKDLKLLDTYSAVILLSLVSVYNIIVMKSGFESVPMALQEAAMIDGAHEMMIFVKVMLPLQKPLIATFVLFNAVEQWNNWYWPMLVLSSGGKTTLQLYLRAIINTAAERKMASTYLTSSSAFTIGIKMASVFVVMAPIMLVYPFLQKYFVKGIMVGAVKM